MIVIAGRCGAIEWIQDPPPPVYSPAAVALWHTQRHAALLKSLQRVEWAKSYLLHLAAVLNERLRLRLCAASPAGCPVPAAAVLSIMQRAQHSLHLQMQFNATDISTVSYLPRLLHTSTCLFDAQSAPASPRSNLLPADAAAASSAATAAHHRTAGTCLATFNSLLSSFMSKNRQSPLALSPHCNFSPLTFSRRKQLQQLLSFAPKNMSIMRRTPVDLKRGPAAAVTDVENRRQMVADTLLQLQHRERRLQEAERCVNASYIFFISTLQVVPSIFGICCLLLPPVV